MTRVFAGWPSLRAVGKPAPPRPTMPQAAMRSRRVSASVVSGSSAGKGDTASSLPSLSKMRCGTGWFAGCISGRGSMARMVPEVGACTGASWLFTGSARSWPRRTRSPGATLARYALPSRWRRLMAYSALKAASRLGAAVLMLLWRGGVMCRPPWKWFFGGSRRARSSLIIGGCWGLAACPSSIFRRAVS